MLRFIKMRLNLATIATVIAIPAAVALGLGAFIGRESVRSQNDPVEVMRMQDVTSQSRLLADAFWSQVEAIRAEALALAQIRAVMPRALPSGRIQYWVHAEIKG